MEQLKQTHPNLFDNQMDDAFRFSILHSMVVMERADQNVIDYAFDMMQKEMKGHPEKNYRMLDELLGEEEKEEEKYVALKKMQKK
jgi:hypothetical protein